MEAELIMESMPRKYYWWSRRDEYDVLKRNTNLYDGVMVGAHMVADGGGAVESRLTALDRPYFVDPRTYGLAMDKEIRGKSECSLVRRIGGGGSDKQNALAARLEEGPLRPRDFGVGGGADGCEDLTRLVVEGTIAIQRGANQTITGREDRPDKRQGGTSLKPEFVVAPYFYARKAASEWLDVNARLLDEAARQWDGAHGVLCLGRDALFEDGAERRIGEAYSRAQGLLVWISGLDDTRANVAELRQYREMLAGLAGTGRPVIALYAGHYATMVAMRHGIRGVVRGIDMNGCRNVEEKGGRGQRRYYLRQAHAHAAMGPASRALGRGPKMRCPCAPCVAALSAARQELDGRGDDGLYEAMLRQMDKGDLAEHFMHAQKYEMGHAAKNRRSADAMVLGDMTREEMGRMRARGVRTEHVAKWIAAMS